MTEELDAAAKRIADWIDRDVCLKVYGAKTVHCLATSNIFALLNDIQDMMELSSFPNNRMAWGAVENKGKEIIRLAQAMQDELNK